MKRKIVLALIASMVLTLGSFGTAFAMNSNPVIELQTNETLRQGGETTEPEEPEEHTHTWGDDHYVIDKEAVYEQIKVVDKPAEYEQIKVVDKEAVYEQIKVVDKPAWDEEIKEVHTICFGCAEQGKTVIMDGWDFKDIQNHMRECGSGSYGQREIVVDVIHHPEESHMETVLVSPEESHMETVLVSPEEWHYENGALISPEEGHWEHTCTDPDCGEIQNSETGEVIKPGTLPEEPTDPSEPTDPDVKPGEDTETPTDPNPDDPTTEKPDNPNTGDNTGEQTDTPKPDQDVTTETTDNNGKPEQQNDGDKTATTDSGDSKTAQTTDSKAQADTTTSEATNENKAPQTGDTASLIYLATLAGSALTGGTAFGLRRKFKK